MADKPIIFSAPMIRALLDGRKTQTRRVLKPQPDAPNATFNGVFGLTNYASFAPFSGGASQLTRLPYALGDRLWVREAFQLVKDDQTGDRWDVYRATTPDASGKWFSPIHMPRFASRLTLTVTDVRVQRLQEISEADARAEGAWLDRCECAAMQPRKTRSPMDAAFRQTWCRVHGDCFRDLWNSLHGPGAWNANPWVCALTFEVHRCNIDQMPGASNG